MEPQDFSPLTHPWLPVVKEGHLLEVSALEALSTPGLLPALEPYEELPALRFLLYLLAWAFQGEDEEEVADAPGEEWRAVVEERTRPHLPALRPFAPGFFLRGEGEIPWTGPEALRRDWPARGGEPALLAHPTKGGRPLRLTPAEAFRATLSLLAHYPPGLYQKLGVTSLPGGPLAEGVAFYALGRDLQTTLRLNLVVPGRLVAPWEGPPSTEPLSLYLWPTRRVAYRLGEGGFLEAVRVYPGSRPPQGLPDPMRAHGEREGRMVFLRVGEGESLQGAVLPRLREYAPPAVLERAAAREEDHGPYALRAVAQVTDQSRVAAFLTATFPPLTGREEAFRLGLGEAAWALGRLLRQAGEAFGEGGEGSLEGGRASGGFAFEAYEVALTAPSEEEGRRRLWSLFLSHLEAYLAPKVRRYPGRVTLLEGRLRGKARRLLFPHGKED